MEIRAPITSLQNSYVKFLRSLKHRKYREREGRFFVEGIRIVEEAVTCGADLERLVFCSGLLKNERAQKLIENFAQRGGRCLSVAAPIFQKLSERDDPQGIGAVIRPINLTLEDLPVGAHTLLVVLDELQDPGNLGATIRTADAAGAAGVVVLGTSADLYDPKTVRSTMGSLFSLPVVRLMDKEVFIGWVRRRGIRIIVSSVHGEHLYFNEDYRGDIALLVGNEARGVDPLLRARADATVRIPMAGRADSLNAASAAAVLVYEVVRQRIWDCQKQNKNRPLGQRPSRAGGRGAGSDPEGSPSRLEPPGRRLPRREDAEGF